MLDMSTFAAITIQLIRNAQKRLRQDISTAPRPETPHVSVNKEPVQIEPLLVANAICPSKWGKIRRELP